MLRIQEVKKYYKKNKGVDGISFSIKKGDLFGLIGANGAGKSTTVSMIATIIKPDSGDILFEGQSILKNPRVIRERLGYVPQDISLYLGLTGRDNLEFWGKAYKVSPKFLEERIKAICDIIGFTQDLLKQKVGTYSGGLKRRLNLGAALLHQPDLVILDEPTVGIDIIARNQILESVKQLNSLGTTILYCGHYMEEVERICNTICILDKGKNILCGNKHELLVRTEEGTTQSKTLEELYYEALGDK